MKIIIIAITMCELRMTLTGPPYEFLLRHTRVIHLVTALQCVKYHVALIKNIIALTVVFFHVQFSIYTAPY